MRHHSLALALLIASPALAFAADKVEVVVHTGHFEKNSSGLTGDISLLSFADSAEFVKVLGVVPPVNVRKSNPVTTDTLADRRVVAVIKRGKAVTTFTEVSVTTDGQTLTVSYKAEAGAPGTATFATPLVLSVPKGKEAKVVFVENGKEVGSTK